MLVVSTAYTHPHTTSQVANFSLSNKLTPPPHPPTPRPFFTLTTQELLLVAVGDGIKALVPVDIVFLIILH